MDTEVKEDKYEKLTITPLGAGQEVGRSCIILQFKNKKVMLDCGIHPGYDNISGLPYFDHIDLETINLVLISHFHADHIQAIPWLLKHSMFKGKCYMTHITKVIAKQILEDCVSLTKNDSTLFNRIDVEDSFKDNRITSVDLKEENNVDGIKITPYRAGHVLGACMWMVEIDGIKVLYTGDYSLEDERHLSGAEYPMQSGEVITPDILICESTHGQDKIETREEGEYRFLDYVIRIVKRGGRALIPIFALGRAQELLLILDEYWKENPDLHKVPIYYGSSILDNAIKVFNQYNHEGKIELSKFVQFIKNNDDLNDSSPCVLLCAPAMLQNGMSRHFFDRWCSDSRNGIILPGYVVDNTLPQKLLKTPDSIETEGGNIVPRNLSIHYISFSGHADFAQTSKFIGRLKPKNVVLIHGGQKKMTELKERLQQLYPDINVKTPGNCEDAVFEFKPNLTALITNKLYSSTKKGDEFDQGNIHISGIIVREEGQYKIMKPTDPELGKTIALVMSHRITLKSKLTDYIKILEENFEKVEKIENFSYIIVNDIIIKDNLDGTITINWKSDPLKNLMADNLAMLFSAPPPQISITEDSVICKFVDHLKTIYGYNVNYHEDDQYISMKLDGNINVEIYLEDMNNSNLPPMNVEVSRNGELSTDDPLIDEIQNYANQWSDSLLLKYAGPLKVSKDIVFWAN